MKKLFASLFACICISSCITMKDQAIFDAPSDQVIPEHIENLYALTLFDGTINGDHWFSMPPDISTSECLDITTVYLEDQHNNPRFFTSTKKSKPSMLWQWDKKAGDCDWLGMGFGWDGWSGKDLSQIKNKAAIQFKVRSKKGTLKSLPLAACFEDYGGNQVWIGFHSKVLPKDGIKDNGWSYVTLPLAEFEWENASAIDMSNVKQFIVQFEASGQLFVDEVKVVPFDGGFNKKIQIPMFSSVNATIDGKTLESEWNMYEPAVFSDYEIHAIADLDKLYFAIKMPSSSFKNKNTLSEIWNGDAIELAFSSRSSSKGKRAFLNSGDRHIGINLETLKNWDWTQQKELNTMDVAINVISDEIFVEFSIPFSDLQIEPFELNTKYGIELVIDKSSSDGLKRESQFRWNSESKQGFNTNPSLWGDLYFIQP